MLLVDELDQAYTLSPSTRANLQLLLAAYPNLDAVEFNGNGQLVFSVHELSVLKQRSADFFLKVWVPMRYPPNAFEEAITVGADKYYPHCCLWEIHNPNSPLIKWPVKCQTTDSRERYMGKPPYYLCTWSAMYEFLMGAPIPATPNPKGKVKTDTNKPPLKSSVGAQCLIDVFMSVAVLGVPRYQQQVQLGPITSSSSQVDIVEHHSSYVNLINVRDEVITPELINSLLTPEYITACANTLPSNKEHRFVLCSSDTCSSLGNTELGLLRLSGASFNFLSYDVMLTRLIGTVLDQVAINEGVLTLMRGLVTSYISPLPYSLQKLPLALMQAYLGE